MLFTVATDTINVSGISNPVVTSTGRIIVGYVAFNSLVIGSNVYELWLTYSDDTGDTWTTLDTSIRSDSPVLNLISLPLRLVPTPNGELFVVWDRYFSGNRSLSVITLNSTLSVTNTINRDLGSYVVSPFNGFDVVNQNRMLASMDEREKIHIFQNTSPPRYLRTDGNIWELENRFSSLPINSNLVSSIYTDDFKYHLFSIGSPGVITHYTIGTTELTIPSVNGGSFLTSLFSNVGNVNHTLTSLTVQHIKVFCSRDNTLFIVLLGLELSTRKIAILKFNGVTWDLVEYRSHNFPDYGIMYSLIKDRLIVDTLQWDIDTNALVNSASVSGISLDTQFNRNSSQILTTQIDSFTTLSSLVLYSDHSSLLLDPNILKSTWKELEITNLLSSLNGTVGDTKNITLNTNFGLPSYRYDAENLPSGLTLKNNKITGILTTKETPVTEITVFDGHNSTDILSGTVTIICSPLQLLDDTHFLPSPIISTPYSYQLQSNNNGEDVTYSIDSGTLPTGLSLSVSGLISGTPSGPIGTVTLDIEGTNSGGTVVETISFEVVNSTTLVFTTLPTLPSGSYNTAYSQNIVASGGTGPYTFREKDSSDLPSGLTLTSGGLLSGTPLGVGNYSFEILARDSNDEVIVETFTLVVDPLPVSITTTTITDGIESQFYSNLLTLTPNGSSVFTTILVDGILTPGIRLKELELVGTPRVKGTYNFDLQVSDGITSDTVSLTHTVTSNTSIDILTPPRYIYENRNFYHQLQLEGGNATTVKKEKIVVEKIHISSLFLDRGYHDTRYPITDSVLVYLLGGSVQLEFEDYVLTVDEYSELKRINWKYLGNGSGISQLIQDDVLVIEYTTIVEVQVSTLRTFTEVPVDIEVVEYFTSLSSTNVTLNDVPLPDTALLIHSGNGICEYLKEWRFSSDDTITWDPLDPELETGAPFILNGDTVIVSYAIPFTNLIFLNNPPVTTNTPHLVTHLYTVTSNDLINEYIDLPLEIANLRAFVVGGILSEDSIDYEVITNGMDNRRFSWEASLLLPTSLTGLQVDDRILFVYYVDTYSMGTFTATWTEMPLSLSTFDKIPLGTTLSSNGILQGIPTLLGDYGWRVNVLDIEGNSKTQGFDTTVLAQTLALQSSTSNSGDGINYTDLSFILDTYNATIENISLLWIGGSVRVDYTLTTPTNTTNNTFDFPGCVQFSLIPEDREPLETDWIDSPIQNSSQASVITGSTVGTTHNLSFEPLYVPVLGVINTLDTINDFRVRLAIGDSTSFNSGVLTSASKYFVSTPIKISDKLALYTRARKNRAIEDGLLSG